MAETNKLKGRIVEKGFTVTRLAETIGLSRQSLGKKLNGLREFSVSEILSLCEVLGITRSEIDDYFFTPKVPKTDTEQIGA